MQLNVSGETLTSYRRQEKMYGMQVGTYAEKWVGNVET